MIHIKKVMEHVYEKIVLSDNGNNSNSSEKMPPEELSALAEAKVEIHCNDMVRIAISLASVSTLFTTCCCLVSISCSLYSNSLHFYVLLLGNFITFCCLEQRLQEFDFKVAYYNIGGSSYPLWFLFPLSQLSYYFFKEARDLL